MAAVLSNKDVNAPVVLKKDEVTGKPEAMSLEYHRQVLQSKMQAGE